MGLWLDQATGRRLDRGLGARRRAKLGPSIVYVKIDCPLGQMQHARDLGGRLAARGYARHASVAGGGRATSFASRRLRPAWSRGKSFPLAGFASTPGSTLVERTRHSLPGWMQGGEANVWSQSSTRSMNLLVVP